MKRLEQAMLALVPQEASAEVEVLGALLPLLLTQDATAASKRCPSAVAVGTNASLAPDTQEQQQQGEEQPPPKRRVSARTRSSSAKAVGDTVLADITITAAWSRGQAVKRKGPLALLTSGDVGSANQPLEHEPAFDSTQVTQRARLLLAVAQRAAGEDVAAVQAAVWNCDEHCIPSAAVPVARHFLAAYNSSDLRLSQQQQHVAMRNTSADVVGDGDGGNRRSRNRSVTPQADGEQPSPPPQQQDAGAPDSFSQSPFRLLSQLVHTVAGYCGPELIHLANATSKVPHKGCSC
jgi:hypothetical protein